MAAYPQPQQQSSYPAQQPSPLTQNSPSTVEASPLQTPGPPLTHGAAETTGRRAPQRAQIACIDCRRSKTKCNNLGLGTTCKACAAKNKQCVYNEGAVVSPGDGSSRRRESSIGGVDAPPRKRKKTLAPMTSTMYQTRNGLGTYETALDSPLLTVKVWKELWTLYEKHFAIDFPFFHKMVFLDPLDQASVDTPEETKFTASSSRRPGHSAPLLLAFLTHTARFHPDLVKQHGDAIATARFYAEATRASLGSDIFDTASLETVQTYLMLGYHNWTNHEGDKGFLRARHAMSCAQLLGYQYDADLDDQEPALVNEEESERNQFINREIQRRTFWSCFCMDRYLSWREKRPQMFKIDELRRVQLPCSDKAFYKGRKVKTRLLGESDEAYDKRRHSPSETKIRLDNESNTLSQDRRHSVSVHDVNWEVGTFEAEIVFYIQAVELLGNVLKWACAGGRRQEGDKPPWLENSNFSRLEQSIMDAKRALPVDFRLVRQNFAEQYYGNCWDKYVLIHALHTVCTVALYREYMAFSPWSESKAKGPLDAPKITDDPPSGPEYWVDQARACWKACQDYAELLQFCKQRGVQVENPVVAFAAYTVGWCAIYCHFFPKMDPDKALYFRRQPSAWEVVNGFLSSMGTRFEIARYWHIQLHLVKMHYDTDRATYKAHGGDPKCGSPESEKGSDKGGGLKIYLRFERAHKEFGSHDGYNEAKHINVADIKLEDYPESEHGVEIASPVTTSKRETRENSEIASGRTPSSISAFTPVNLPETPKASSVTLHQPPADARSHIYGQQPSNPPPFPVVDHRAYQDVALPTNTNFQNKYGYYTQQDYAALPANQGVTHAQWHGTAYAPRLPNLNPYPSQQQVLSDDEFCRVMDGRGIKSGDFTAFTNGGSAYGVEPSNMSFSMDGWMPSNQQDWPPYQ